MLMDVGKLLVTGISNATVERIHVHITIIVSVILSQGEAIKFDRLSILQLPVAYKL